MIKLKNVCYLGKFFEYEKRLGWMPWHKVFITMLLGFDKREDFEWVSQKDINWVRG